jgi:spermidine synthase
MNSSGRGVPLFFHPVILLSGIASGIAMHVWFRMYSTLFGIHLFSELSILVTLILCLSAGSRIGGRLADKVPNQLNLFVVLQAITGMYSLFHPAIFGSLLWTFDLVNASFHPAPFGMGIIRIALTLFFLFIPLACIGGLVPVLSRYFTNHTLHAGNRMSSILSLISAGLAGGLIISGFFLIPQVGMQRAIKISSLIGLFVSIISLVSIFGRKAKMFSGHRPIMTKRAKHSAMLFRKRKPVLETSSKLMRSMIRVHVLHGFTSISLLIIAGRMIVDYATIGHSYVNILVISVYLAGLAFGSTLYKSITRRMVNGYLMMASLEILTGFAILFSLVLFSITAPMMHEKGLQPASWLNIVAFQLIPVSSLLLLPALITGLLLPLTGRLYARRIQYSGRNTGRLYSLYFTGAWFGLLVTNYILIPIIGSFYTSFVLILIALLSGIYLLYKDSRLIRGFRLSYSATTLACITGVLFACIKMGWLDKGPDRNTEAVRGQHEGSAKVSLYVKPDNKLSLTIDGIVNLETGTDGSRVQQIPVFLSCVMSQSVQSSLVIGFGMGLTAAALEDCDVPAIYVTEVFPQLLALSSDVFADENNDILTSSRVDVAIEDARLFITRFTGRFDLITSGYTDLHILPGFFTTGFYRTCFSKLTGNGMLTQILPIRGIDGQEFRSLVKACTDVFPQVSMWYISRDRILLMANKKEASPDYCSAADRFDRLDKLVKFSRFGLPDPESLIGRQIMDPQQLRIFVKSAPENSDDRPNVEFSRTTLQYSDTVLINQLIRNFRAGDDWFESAVRCSADIQEIQRKTERTNQSVREELLHGRDLPSDPFIP